jgi:hypothetical protein
MNETINYRADDYARIAAQCIKQLSAEFRENPYDFFSESDVKCRLIMTLLQHKAISSPKQSFDKKLISPLHTEVSYFDDEGRLFFHVDVSAVDPAYTNVYSNLRTGRIKLSKGYRADVCYFAIELKMNKQKKKKRMLEMWEKDMAKLVNIRTRNRFLTCFSVLFDKKPNNAITENEFEDLRIRYPQIKLAYANIGGGEFLGNF